MKEVKQAFLFAILALLVALPVGAQKAKGGITMSLSNEPLASALRMVQQKSDYKVSFVVEDVKSYTTTVHLKNATAISAVKQILNAKPFTYSVSGKFITVKKVAQAHPAQKKGGKVKSDIRNLAGNIVDEEGEPMIGATVSVPGSPYGTVTDTDGHFSFYIPKECGQVLVSYVGMESQSVKVSGKDNVKVVMSENKTLLDDVVVTGYQTISKERATGSFTKVTASDLKDKRLSDLSTVLAGEVAGYNDGLIRGVTTMNASTSPLYVIDGFPVEKTKLTGNGNGIEEDLPDLNMDDIESITVLKDAAAASIYGARAANGVIVVTTKKSAAKGKTNVSFNASLTWHPYSYYTGNLASSDLVVDLEKEWASQNPNLTGDGVKDYAKNMLSQNIYPSSGIRSILNYYAGNISESEMNATLSRLAAKGYNYYDQMEKYAKRDPLYQQYNVNIVNNSVNNLFKASVTYKHDALEDKYSNNQSLGLNLTNSTNFTKWLSLDLGAYFKIGEDNTQDYSVLSPGYSILPYDDLVNADGSNYTKPMSERYNASTLALYQKYGLYNMDITPLDELGRQITTNKELALRTFARLNIQFFPWLKYSASFQYERASYRGEALQNKASASVRGTVNNYAVEAGENSVDYAIPYGDILTRTDQYTSAYNFRQQLNFDKTFSDVHSVTAILGTETIQNKQELHRNKLFNYDSQMLSSSMVNNAAINSGVNGVLGYSSMLESALSASYENVNRYVSVYGNAAYTYDDRYSVTGSLRWDRSNLWGTSSKYQNKPIWSVGASWIISKEKFFHVHWVDYLKLRVSDGIAGNVSKNSAPYMVAGYSNNSHVGGTQGYVQSRANPMLSWEKTNTLNIGVDFAMLKNRLTGTIEYYNKKGTDLLASTMGNPTEGWGYSTYTINNGEMYNRGVEISLSGEIVRAKDFSWRANMTYAYNKNKVTYVNVKAPVYFLQLDYPYAYPVVGNEYNAIYAYKWAGLSEEGLPQVYNENGEKVSDQPTTLDAIVYAGTTTPKYSGSFGTSVSYKNFDLSLQFLFAGGHKVRNANPAFLACSYSSIGYISNIAGASAGLADRWQKAGDEMHTNVPKAVFAESDWSASSLYNTYYYADINVLDASYIRLNNISLAYHLPKAVCRSLYMQSARIQANVENPFFWAKSSQVKYQLGGYNATNYVLGIYLNF